jgi:integrase
LLTVDDLLELYFDGLDADRRMSRKTLADYRNYARFYVRPLLGSRKAGEVTPEVILAWQRRLAEGGRRKDGSPLAANTIRLARAPLAGAFKLAVQTGIVPINPVSSTPPPSAGRRIPRHWAPEQAQQFLALMEGDRTWPLWAFLLGSGLRIGELVWLRWLSVDFARKRVQVIEFATVVDYQLVHSMGKSAGAVRSIELDKHLIGVLKSQRQLQADERLTGPLYEASDYVFTKPEGGAYHPQYVSRTLGKYSTQTGLPRLTAHGLRHTSATLMLANGIPPKVAAERLGHADPTLFMNLYSHVTPTMQREAAEKIGKILFSRPGFKTVRS